MDFKEVRLAMDEYERLSTKRQEIEANLKRLREETERLMIERDQLNAEIKVYLLAEDPVLERRVDWKAMQPRVYGQLRYYEFEDGHQIETYRDLISLTPWELTDFRSFGFRALELLEEHLDSIGLALRDGIPPPYWKSKIEQYFKKKEWTEKREKRSEESVQEHIADPDEEM